MAKRTAGEQITKDTYQEDPDDRDPGGRERSVEPMTVASTEVLQKRKILKPRSRTGGTPARASVASSGLFQPTTTANTPIAKPSFGNLFGSQALSTPFSFGAPATAQTEPPKPNPFTQATSTSSLFGASTTEEPKKPNPFASLSSVTANPFNSSINTSFLTSANARATTPPQTSNAPFTGFGSNPPSTPKPSTPAAKSTPSMFGGNFGTVTTPRTPLSNVFSTTSSDASTALPSKALFGTSSTANTIAAALSSTPAGSPAKNTFGSSISTGVQDFSASTQSNSLFGRIATPTKDDSQSSKPAETFSPAPASMFQIQTSTSGTGSSSQTASGDVAYPSLFTAPKPLEPKKDDKQFESTGLDKPNAFSGFMPTNTGFGGSAPVPSTQSSKPLFQFIPPQTNGATTPKDPPHNVQSLTPPPDSDLDQNDMPDFNYIVQISSLNKKFFKQLETAFMDDPLGDWTKWVEFYRDQMSSFKKLRDNQKAQTGGGENANQQSPVKSSFPVDKSMTDAPSEETNVSSSSSKMFESMLGTSQSAATNNAFSQPDPKNNISSSSGFQHNAQRETSSETSKTTSSGFGLSNNMFAQPAQSSAGNAQAPTSSLFPAQAQTSMGSSLFGSKPAPSTSGTSSFQFGSQNTVSTVNTSQDTAELMSNMFEAKPATSIFNFGVKPSGASTPGGSVLASGSSGLANANDGGWQNPFTKEKNAMFITDTSDKSDDESAEDGNGVDEQKHDEVPTDVDTSPDLNQSQNKGDSTQSAFNTSSPFQFGSSTPKASGSGPAFAFGASTTPKTGSVGLFGSINTTKDKDHTWSRDQPVTFGPKPTEDTKTETKPGLFGNSGFGAPAGLFGGGPPASSTASPSTGGLFGSSTANPTSIFNLSSTQSTAAKAPSLGFNFASSADSPKPSLFGNNGNSLAPPSIFGGAAKSPLTSGANTPATDVESGGATDTGVDANDGNEPSDEAGQGPNTSADLSGPGPGEEDEDTKFDVRSSIYQLTKGQYVMIGIGRLRVLRNRVNDKGRIVAKMDTGKILMNVSLRKDVDYSLQGGEAESKVVKVLEVLPAGQGSRVWVMKVRQPEDAAGLRKAINENK